MGSCYVEKKVVLKLADPSKAPEVLSAIAKSLSGRVELRGAVAGFMARGECLVIASPSFEGYGPIRGAPYELAVRIDAVCESLASLRELLEELSNLLREGYTVSFE